MSRSFVRNGFVAATFEFKFFLSTNTSCILFRMTFETCANFGQLTFQVLQKSSERGNFFKKKIKYRFSLKTKLDFVEY